MKLYNGNFSPNALRVRAVIYELGIDVDKIEVDFRVGDNRTPEFLKLNPNGKVPVLVDGDVVIWESRAINAYLATKHPARGLYPADPRQRALIDQWSYWQAVHLGPAMQRVAFERVQKPLFGRGQTDEAAIVGELENVDQFLDVFEQGLRNAREWIVGYLSLADFALATTFVYRVGANISLETRPRVAEWVARNGTAGLLEASHWRHAAATEAGVRR
jgi:glutathione S-transferase